MKKSTSQIDFENWWGISRLDTNFKLKEIIQDNFFPYKSIYMTRVFNIHIQKWKRMNPFGEQSHPVQSHQKKHLEEKKS